MKSVFIYHQILYIGEDTRPGGLETSNHRS